VSRGRLPEDLILTVVGIPCAGKTTIGEYLAAAYGFSHVESSSVLPAAGAKFGYEQPDKPRLANELFTSEGYGVVEEHAIANGMVPVRGRTVYTGIRTVEGVAVVLAHAHSRGVPCFVLFVDVEVPLAVDRNTRRGRDANTSEASYHERLRWDREFGAVLYANVMADWRIANTASLAELRKNVDDGLAGLAGGQRRRDDVAARELAAIGPVGDLDTPVARPDRLAAGHPTLLAGGGLSSRGRALFRILRLRHGWA
jgi:AAA domain-containing protein